ncbi:uncharacterized protein FIBRA_01998 [Fibroporia radiculosa]|uniref:Enoyl-CoA hydratase n=1 Tax=Fibroporia radiculosa TaxID=599839 RepID=J4G1A7_9APHY|nr:uncharacterized protein FIBRA_01998 [Fibroporia radiculosa]CCL99973.1 predicted protein [Fibroporia radiculosa]
MSTTTLDALSGRFIKVSSPGTHIALVELSQRDVSQPRNAFVEEFWTEFGHVFDKISGEPYVRVVVLASAIPKHFSAGIDLGALAKLNTYDSRPDRRALQIREFITLFQDSISAIERCPYPVIVAAHGTAIGLSLDIISACDIRYAASNVLFSIKEVDIGLAADIGTLARLPKISGNQSLVHELAYTARNFSAAEAQQIGLVSRVVEGGRDEVLHVAMETATMIASKSPIAVLGTKRLLLHSRDHSVKENLEYTALWNSAMLQTEDIKEAMKAGKTKQKPSFSQLAKLPSKL